MKHYQVKDVRRAALNAKQNKLQWRVESLYNKLHQFYGTQELVLKANKLDAIELMNSDILGDKVLALRRILLEDPTINRLQCPDQLSIEVAALEDIFSELYTRRQIEEDLHNSIQKKMDEKHNEYIQDIKLQILKEQKNSPENAQTLKNLGRLEKMENINLNKSVLDILRPSTFDEIIGQDKAVKALVAKLNTPYPQHILLFGPPGVGKTSCARLALELVKDRTQNCFSREAPFIEVDGTTLRWDPRESTNPLLGSVHDPIYQGARKDLAEDGIPEPKLGLVSDAHGGILFIDEIGEMDASLQNKLLKVLEDKRVSFESAYYDPNNERIPRYIKQMFEQGVPADFVLIGATTRSPEEINPALRSRCMEIFFEPLTPEEIRNIVKISANKLKILIETGVPDLISDYADDGRSANKLLGDAYSIALNKVKRDEEILLVGQDEVYEAVQNSRITLNTGNKASEEAQIGKIFGLGAYGYRGRLLEIEAIAFPSEPKGEGRVRFNETAGSMAKDSVFNAASVIRSEFGENIYDFDLHINFIGGGKVDGPSAGTAVYLAILSALKGKPVRQDIAVTGEISIQGRVKPVGGLHEKVHAARQAGIKKILIPHENREDLSANWPGIEIIPITFVNEAYPHVFS
ncbi:atp-dependent protease lonb-like type i [hydrocarbon metagenome]|uniref:Atp-dependent protease lonb-like type i n=1 Tax=hydrocarbon metagenome TaxID=938273 RepID=A0A0W8E2I7_9ZZZZ